ncbi:hypothetical protein NBRC116589_34850 [Ruegeria sp. HU-ET01832]
MSFFTLPSTEFTKENCGYRCSFVIMAANTAIERQAYVSQKAIERACYSEHSIAK